MLEKAVCVVICNYNKRNDVLKAVDSILASTQRNIETLVVDNASTDGSCAALREVFGNRIELIELTENTGGAGGFSRGMQWAATRTCDYVLLLDNDARVTPETISGLVAMLESDPDCAIVAPVIFHDDGSELIQECGGSLSDTFTFAPNFRRHTPDSISRGPIECDYVPACCLLTRAETIRKVGAFDPSYFLYWDDIEWCGRVRSATQGKIYVDTKIRAYHKGGASTNPLSHYFYWRNRLRFFASRLDENAWQDFIRTISFEAMRAILHTTIGGRGTTANAIVDALHDAATGTSGARPTASRVPLSEHFPTQAPQFKVAHVHSPESQICPAGHALVDSYNNVISPLEAPDVARLTRLASDTAALIGAALSGVRRHYFPTHLEQD